MWMESSIITLILLKWRIGWAPNNTRKWQMGFNSAFKGLNNKIHILLSQVYCVWQVVKTQTIISNNHVYLRLQSHRGHRCVIVCCPSTSFCLESTSTSGRCTRTGVQTETECRQKDISHFFEHFFLLWRCDPTRVMASSFLRFSRSHTTTHHSR